MPYFLRIGLREVSSSWNGIWRSLMVIGNGAAWWTVYDLLV